MLTMVSCTVGAGEKRKPWWPSCKPAWRSAAWRCIRPKPKSSTAKTTVERERIRTSHLTSSDMAFDPGGSKARGTRVLWLQSRGERLGAEVDAGEDTGLEYPKTNARDDGRNRPAAQSNPQRLDRILRTVHALGAA